MVWNGYPNSFPVYLYFISLFDLLIKGKAKSTRVTGTKTMAGSTNGVLSGTHALPFWKVLRLCGSQWCGKPVYPDVWPYRICWPMGSAGHCHSAVALLPSQTTLHHVTFASSRGMLSWENWLCWQSSSK